MRLSRSRLVVVALEAAFILSVIGAPGGVIAARPADVGNPHAAPTATPDPVPDPVAAADPAPTASPETAPVASPDATATLDPIPAHDPATGSSRPSTGTPGPDGEVGIDAISVLELVVTPDPFAAGDTITLTATMTPDPGCGSIDFAYAGTALGSAALTAGVASTTTTAVDGVRDATATFPGCNLYSFTSVTIQVGQRADPGTPSLDADRYTATQYEQPVTFTFVLPVVDATGTVTLYRDVNAIPEELATGALTGDVTQLTVANLPVGSYDVYAVYGGDTMYLPSAASNPVTMAIGADTSVRTSGVGTQYLSFYPVKDDYRDKDIVRGRTLEPATVTIRIYNSNGTRVKYWALGSKNGAYSATWSGRRTDGTLLPAGTYTVKQQFKDLRGNAKTVTTKVTLSHKKLYWYVKSQTRYADTGVFGYNGSAGAYKSTRFYRGAVLDGGYYDDEVAIARYQFSLPNATIYRSIRVAVYGKSMSPYGKGFMTVNNWVTDELDGYRTVGYATDWYSSSLAAKDHVNSNGTVRVFVAAVGANLGLVDYGKVKLVYKYAVLR